MAKNKASTKYIECLPAANKWLNEHAPDFVVECMTEVTDHLQTLKTQLDERDQFIMDLCDKFGVDPSKIFK